MIADGRFGPLTLAAVNGVENHGALHAAISSEAAGYYRLLVEKRPEFAKYKAGWLGRAYD